MRIYTLFIVAIISVFFVSACWTTETANVEENSNIVSNGNENTESNEKTENISDSIDYESLPETPNASMSPTETLMAFNRATESKDAKRIKTFLSKGSMQMIEKSAKEQNKTVDQLLTDGEDAVEDEKPSIRNQKIIGDTATVEVKNQVLGNYDEMPFVKEDGIWKIALDKFMEDMMRKINESQIQAPEPEKGDVNKQSPEIKGKNPEKK